MADKDPVSQDVVKALIVDNGMVLFLWDPNILEKDKWETPGGRKRDGESDTDALERESLEEAGIKIEMVRFIDKWELPLPQRGWILKGKSYLCKPLTKEVRLEDEEKQHTEYRWVKIDEAIRMDLTPWLKTSLSLLFNSI